MYLSIPVFNRKMVVLGNIETAQALLESRGAIYSSRPEFTLFTLCVLMWRLSHTSNSPHLQQNGLVANAHPPSLHVKTLHKDAKVVHSLLWEEGEYGFQPDPR